MTDEQDGQPRRQAVDGPTVMGPSTGHLHGPAPEDPVKPRNSAPDDDPTLAGTRPGSPAATPRTEPASTAPTRANNQPATSNDEPTLADPPAGETWPRTPAPHGDPTLAAPPATTPAGAWPGTPATTPQNDPTLAAPPATPTAGPWPSTPPATPQDEPTLADPASPATRPEAPGQHHEPTPADPAPHPTWASNPPATPDDDPTLADPPATPTAGTRPSTPAPQNDPTLAAPPATPTAETWPSTPAPQGDPTLADPTLVGPAPQSAWPDGPTVATPVDDVTVPDLPDDPTMAVVDESPTTTGPTVASWPLDELLPPPPTDLVWRPDTPEPPPSARRPGYYVALGAAVVLVVALVAVAALVAVVRPTREVAGTAGPTQAIPDITGTAPPPATTTARPQAGPAEHPLSTSTARMADATCALPRFDLADDRQAAFYAAAKTCADDAWRGVLDEAGLTAAVEVVTVTGPVRTASCGELTPASPATQCDGTVYMTPAHLRDTERNGRYPGRYFGVFLREYARALQFTTGLSKLVATVDDAEARLAQQATCMAGIASGAMANRGAVDANITGEISDRLSSVDAPPDAKAMLDKGFEERNLKACNTW